MENEAIVLMTKEIPFTQTKPELSLSEYDLMRAVEYWLNNEVITLEHPIRIVGVMYNNSMYIFKFQSAFKLEVSK